MSRHRAPARRRRTLLAVTLILAVAATTVVALWRTQGSLFGLGGLADAATTEPSTPDGEPSATEEPCPTGEPVRVVAASGIEDVVTAAAAAACLELDLQVDDSAAPAAALSAGDIDVWVPDSRVRALPLIAQGVAAPSVAVSPIVMAADEETAASIAPEGRTSWGLLLSDDLEGVQMPAAAESSTSVVVAGPLSGLAQQVTGDRYLGIGATASVLATATHEVDGEIPAGTVRVAEQRLLTDVPGATVLEVAEGVPHLDYPFLVAETSEATDALLAALGTSAATAALTDSGLLPPGATALTSAAGDPVAVLPVASPQDVPLMLALESTGGVVNRMISAIDVSGSMGLADTPGGPSRIETAVGAMATAMAGLAVDNQIELWEFAYELDGEQDWRRLISMAPVVDAQGQVNELLQSLDPDEILAADRGTSLYQTVLDGFTVMSDDYVDGANNIMAVFTDGRDEDAPGRLGLEELITQLEDAYDPDRPVQLLLIGFGDADIDALTQIADAVDGQVVQIDRAEQILGAMLVALAGTIAESASA